MRSDPVVVIGTTPDYIVKIHKKYPEAACFVIDSRFLNNTLLQSIEKSSLLFCSLENYEETLRSVDRYLSLNRLSPQGVACFDCESLILASKIAVKLDKPFPPTDAIIQARNKFESRRIWTEAGVLSPSATVVSGLRETLAFFHKIRKEIVLKPVSGSGSELLFHCENEEEVVRSVQIMEEELPKRKSNPLFRPIPGTSRATPVDPCGSWIAEEFVCGYEFSCDFILENGRITILRETGKVKAPGQTFGSILAYTFPPSYPEGFSLQNLSRVLKVAASSLGFTWGHFMVDYIIRNGQPVLIEMTPRPGGDSLPELVEIAAGYDLLGLHLDIVAGKFRPLKVLDIPPETFASINLYAPKGGIITGLDPSPVLSLSWVKAVFLKKDLGDRVILPPADYDNRLLGYCIISLQPTWDLLSIYHYLQKLLRVSILDHQHDEKGYHHHKEVARHL
jgi:hypothetical protein